MELSSEHCRKQEAIHRDLAANAQLENTRIISLRAATAWAKEATSAEKREKRKALQAIARQQALHDKELQPAGVDPDAESTPA